ncbi:MAG: adenine phosphoribosyltransferase [Thermoplasmatota archaeon]
MDPDRIERLISSFEGIPIVESGGYQYFVHPLSDGIPSITPEILDDATRCIMELLPKPNEFDLLITAEAMGIPLTTALSNIVGKPFSIARKRRYDLKGEVTVGQETGYSTSDLHLNLPEEGGLSVIIDDVLSTGGTLNAMVKGIRRSGWEVKQAVFLFNKMERGRIDRMEREIGIKIRSLLDLDLHMGAFKARRSRDD